jgi:hypothetical protein
MARPSAALVLACLIGFVPASVRGEDQDPLLRRIDELERRVRELEAERAEARAYGEPGTDATSGKDAPSNAADWTRRVRISGSANAGYYNGSEASALPDGSFAVRDARFFVDAELANDVRLGDTVLFRTAGASLEWNLVRLGELDNDVGELYGEFQGIGDSSWLNLQVGRFQIPVGEAYLRYSRGYWDQPFVTNPVGAPWWWDEGVKLYGSDEDDRLGYVASLTNGETSFDEDASSDEQATLKLFTNPTPWLHLSVSGLRSGTIGSVDDRAMGALWLGETWARAFGAGSDLPNLIGGGAVADGPNELEDTTLLGADVILRQPGWGHLWLGSGTYRIDSAGASLYDRELRYWIAELLVEASLVLPELDPFYVALRAAGLGTGDGEEGYLLDSRYSDRFGYNMEELTSYSAVLGWKLTPNLRLRLEYTHSVIELVRGASAALGDPDDRADQLGLELGLHF